MMPNYYEFCNSVKILSGENALENLSFELSILNCARPMMITDAMLEKIGTYNIVKKSLKGIDTSTLFTDVPTDSSIAVIKNMKTIYAENGCDGIIAVGGGSVIDTAKGLRMLLSQNESSVEKLMGYDVLKKGKFIPFVVVPTTSGTGSETTLVAVIADKEQNRKMEFISYEMLPNIAVIDPRMTMTLPPKLTASTAIDALCHAVEAYSCNQKNPLSDAYAISAIKLISENIIPTVRDGNFKEGRVALANAALMAGISFSNSMVGLVHAIAHSVGGVAKVSHAEAVAILMPYVMEFNLEYCEEEYANLLLFLTNDEEYVHTFKNERAKKSITVIKDMLSKLKDMCGLPTTLSEKGVKEYQFNEIAQKSLEDGALILNKRRATKQQIIEILQKAF